MELKYPLGWLHREQKKRTRRNLDWRSSPWKGLFLVGLCGNKWHQKIARRDTSASSIWPGLFSQPGQKITEKRRWKTEKQEMSKKGTIQCLASNEANVLRTRFVLWTLISGTKRGLSETSETHRSGKTRLRNFPWTALLVESVTDIWPLLFRLYPSYFVPHSGLGLFP